jgi:molybdate transport system substrate-binding protein
VKRGLLHRIARLARAGLTALAAITPIEAGAQGENGAVVVFAAASLKTALDDAAARWTAQTGAPVTTVYAGTASLARQIAQGAPADLFVSANIAWMDALQRDGLIDPASRRDLFRNRLALVAATGAATPTAVAPGLDLPAMLGGGRMAMAFVDAVPAGIYGKTALETLGLWDAVADRVAQTDSVRAALALVARGAAPLGVVYATDAAAEPRVTLVGLFPEVSHPPIVYPAAATPRAGAQARAMLEFLSGPQGRAVFAAHGFLTGP